MGQQQLLLVILVTIIVGIATVVAINVFGTSAKSANEDAVRQDILTIASSAQGWYIKPEMMGGGGNSFSGIDFTKFNFSASDIDETNNNMTAKNMNGTYVLAVENSGTDLRVTAHPSSDETYAGSTADFPTAAADAQLEAVVTKGNINWDS
ncbi:hypothetical protein [Fodinibius sp. SL11]|uniref:hypothetical protein n=1 Tax=Fodinibius sp. SL11 TaxID=3425690 RepID=UPI003F883508